MKNSDEMELPCGCELIHLPNITDDRGMLAFGECSRHIPFDIKRVFWTYNVSDGNSRGNHAHRTCSMVLFPIGGSFSIELDDGVMKTTIQMDRPHIGILIPPGVWCNLFDFTSNAACICLASHPYDPEDYIHDYGEFLKFIEK